MSVRRKKRILNIIMVLLILVIAACAVVAVGSVKGWFFKDKAAPVKAASAKGIVNIQRGGISYSLEDGAAVQTGDIVETRRLAQAVFALEESSSVVMNEDTTLRWDAVSEEGAYLTLTDGEIFGDTWQYHKGLTFAFDGGKSDLAHAVFSAGTLPGSCYLCVYVGDLIVELPDGDVERVETGESLLLLTGEGAAQQAQVYPLQASALSDFQIEKLLSCASLEETCFTREELLAVLEDREAQKKAALEAALLESVTEAATEEMTEDATERESEGETDSAFEAADFIDDADGLFADESLPGSGSGYTGTGGGQGGQSAAPAGGGNASGDAGSAGGGSGSDSGSGTGASAPAASSQTGSDAGSGSSSEDTAARQPAAQAAPRCTIEIRCDTILDNMENLTAGKEVYVPVNGVILSTSTVEFTDGDTVFDVLTRVCSAAGIQIEYSWTPMYDSYYIEGINNLYEFDCGNESGWMYKVNGWFPNYGCSSYTLSDGDVIVWCYTCNGLGADVGGAAY